MLGRLIYAIAVAIIVFVVCVILGVILEDLGISILADLGKLLREFAVLIAAAFGLLAFASGKSLGVSL